MSPGEPRTYHHGDLRSALLCAALALLEDEGPNALSLRRLARTVGVSPMAPYHHFADREALLAAVATLGFERLQERKLETERAHASAREALAIGAAAYVRFILDNPNLYRLMKGPVFADRTLYPDLQRAAAAPARTLLTVLGRLQAEHAPALPPAEEAAQMLWGLAHGIGTLALDGQVRREAAPDLAQSAATAMIDGWLGT
ncbi:TetR/AcrR family transcriptional regulator [Novosphingobium sp.]|uniref:TetR/AcrR family transcriptional regulator n=1 Tax=Novosphingobium sp. TaxID=1874826 RepID=UPI00260F91CE|nr:TetR/AcrR family transcriptional regulator [Novosphingobium sp.]